MNYRNNKGSITLYVVLSLMFLLMATAGTYINLRNKEAQQEQEIERIQRNYRQVVIESN